MIPTVHEGPHVRKMEKKGIRTEKGELNRWIKATNRMIRNIQATLAALKEWLAEAKAILKEPQEVYLAQLLSDAHAANIAKDLDSVFDVESRSSIC